jgi:hypothetical protein
MPASRKVEGAFGREPSDEEMNRRETDEETR